MKEALGFNLTNIECIIYDRFAEIPDGVGVSKATVRIPVSLNK